MDQIIECIPNFSEGRNPARIQEIVNAIGSVAGIKLLDVSSGKSANRTVVTFAGDPLSVVEAAFRGIQKAASVLDMSTHTGVHPRFGATDVCPLVPVANISMEETVHYARQLAERVGKELLIPVYCYEYAAFNEDRRSLAHCRMGGYEGLKLRITTEKGKPDFGPDTWSEAIAKSGAVAIGARNFLIAYNINLNTTSSKLAHSIALEVRESGRLKRDKEKESVIYSEEGAPERIPGTLRKTRAIGWYIEEFGIAQVSMNLTDLSVTPVHLAFDEVCEKAQKKGLRVTGSEIVGLIPLHALLEAGKYFLRKQKRSTGVSDEEILKIAVKSLGLDDLHPFDFKRKIIEYLLDNDSGTRLADKRVSEFVYQTASESLGPGGGAVSAATGAMGAALAGMTANLSAQKKGWEHRWEEFSGWAEKAKHYHQVLLNLIDEDAKAFTQLYNVLKLPVTEGGNPPDREQLMLEASKNAIEVPLQIMKNALEAMDVLHEMALLANPNTISDTGVGTICAKASVESAFLSVQINAMYCNDRHFVNNAMKQALHYTESAAEKHGQVMNITSEKIKDLQQKNLK